MSEINIRKPKKANVESTRLERSIGEYENFSPSNDFTNLWIFAYGSLMWDIPFPFKERQISIAANYERLFCMLSVIYRGTFDTPGLVLALDFSPGQICIGTAFRIARENAGRTLKKLRDRELGNASGYIEKFIPVKLNDGRMVQAVTYCIDRSSKFYKNVSTAEQAKIILNAKGSKGENYEYLFNTVNSLKKNSIVDQKLNILANETKLRLRNKYENLFRKS